MKVAVGRRETDGIVFDVTGGAKVVVALVDRERGPVMRTVELKALTERTEAGPDDRDPVDAAGDCELIGQIKQKVLPLFATRSVDYSSTCERHHLLVGATRLKAEVLVADESAAADSAAR